MSRESAVIILGFLVVIVPFLGFPEHIRILFFVLMGVALASVGFSLRAQSLSRGDEKGGTTFVENSSRRLEDTRTADHGQTETNFQ